VLKWAILCPCSRTALTMLDHMGPNIIHQQNNAATYVYPFMAGSI
jgi:hypothetical protein